jgi:hypothetical protein
MLVNAGARPEPPIEALGWGNQTSRPPRPRGSALLFHSQLKPNHMKTTDRYTRVMLTLIAACLCILTLQQVSIFPQLQASESSTISNYALVPVNEDGSITVRLSAGEELDVNITDISTSDELNVNIDEIGGGWVSHGGPISVTID